MSELPGPPWIVFPRSAPDLDGVACAYAYAELLSMTGRPARPWIHGRPDAEARYALSYAGATPPDASELLAEAALAYVLVDASGLEGLPPGRAPDRIVEVIDHRPAPNVQRLFPNARCTIDLVGAAATLVAERFHEAGVRPSRSAALLLQGAIYSNTLSLKGAVTTPRDHAMEVWLKSIAPLAPSEIAAQFAARRDEVLADLPAATARELKTFDHPEGSFGIAQLELPDIAGLVVSQRAALAEILAARSRLAFNLVDPVAARSMLLAIDPQLQALLTRALATKFDGWAASFAPGLLRKQITAAIFATGSG
jgi:inorganic pyrophosphatase/exopolyphosphatase